MSPMPQHILAQGGTGSTDDTVSRFFQIVVDDQQHGSSLTTPPTGFLMVLAILALFWFVGAAVVRTSLAERHSADAMLAATDESGGDSVAQELREAHRDARAVLDRLGFTLYSGVLLLWALVLSIASVSAGSVPVIAGWTFYLPLIAVLGAALIWLVSSLRRQVAAKRVSDSRIAILTAQAMPPAGPAGPTRPDPLHGPLPQTPDDTARTDVLGRPNPEQD